jgi:hypothetical protein
VSDWETLWAVEHGIGFFIYCWHVQNSPSSAQAMDAQLAYTAGIQKLGIVPQVPTVSQAWSG